MHTSPQCRGWAQGAKRRAQKPDSEEGWNGEPKEMHTSFCNADAEGRVEELRKAPQKPHLIDFGLQRRVGLGDRNSGKNFRDK